MCWSTRVWVPACLPACLPANCTCKDLSCICQPVSPCVSLLAPSSHASRSGMCSFFIAVFFCCCWDVRLCAILLGLAIFYTMPSHCCLLLYIYISDGYRTLCSSSSVYLYRSCYMSISCSECSLHGAVVSYKLLVLLLLQYQVCRDGH